MTKPTCLGCSPIYKPFPSGMAWAHSTKCRIKKKRGQKIVHKVEPLPVTKKNARVEGIRAQRHMAETARTGLGLTTTKTFPRGVGMPPIPLAAPGDECPAHPSENRFDCGPCAELGD